MDIPRIYLDHAATTPMHPEAVVAMLPWLTGRTGNPSGSHQASRDARRAVDDARESIAAIIGFDPGDVTFTSGGTEADNLAVLGRHQAVGGRVVCSAIEHPAVLEAAQSVGAEIAVVDGRGCLVIDQLSSMLDVASGTPVTLVSIMATNNEIGVIQPMADIAEVVRARAPQAMLHTDAVQSLPWLDLRPLGELVDAMSLSAHKFGGPTGVGVLAMRRGLEVSARQLGGGQERERRSGTHNVAGIVAMAEAARITDARRASEVVRIAALRDRLVDAVLARIDDVFESGDRRVKVAGNAHLCFGGLDSEALLFLLDDAGVCASAASACASGAQHPSHVLEAIGADRSLAGGSLRLTLGHTTTEADVDGAIDALVVAVERLRRFPR